MSFQIAIDGPVAAGKSSIAKLLSDKLNLTYIDTGAMYRAVAMAAAAAGVDLHDEDGVVKIAKKVKLELRAPRRKEKDGRPVTVLLNDLDVSWEIRKIENGEGASIIGTHPKLRKVLVKMQQEMCNGKRVVMEGRDIGTVVLPNADLKVFMMADQKVRIQRKLEQLQNAKQDVTVKEVKADVKSRDTREMEREVDPLRPAEDAWTLDTTDLSMRQVVNAIIKQVDQIKKK